ncbi:MULTISPECIES: hypothetical protein [Enterobacterales]|uniref:hypothetical protein n=1 Tax=Enterobacterales TaxID=91347 RepID=UPI002EDB90AC
MNYILHRVYLVALVVFILICWLALNFAHAEECRHKISVRDSGLSNKNNSYGGHVNQHIYGAKELPVGKDQLDKTLFTSIDEYTGFWNNYINDDKYTGPGVQCSSNEAGQRVKVNDVLSKDAIGAFSCMKSNDRGECTEKIRKQFTHVQLYFGYVGGKWILITAYPTN